MMRHEPARVLVVAAHPDDEALGCGATIAKWTRAGAAVQIVFMADGVGARGLAEPGVLDARRNAARRAAQILGAAAPVFGDFPDNRCDSVPLLDIVQDVETLVRQFQPDTVLTHHAGDLNVDHQRVHEAVMTACRPQKGHSVRTCLFFEVPSSTEWRVPGCGRDFSPAWFEDVGATLALKLQALDAYAGEMRPWPHPRSQQAVTALARWRGATVGCDAAEAFMLGRVLR